jgi:flagellin-like hook-associated protein FlgL
LGEEARNRPQENRFRGTVLAWMAGTNINTWRVIMIINHNMSAMYANRQLDVTQVDATKSLEKLSSGLRINRAGDDASGLAVSEKLRAQIRGLNQAERNTLNGVSFIQTAEGYLQETQDVLHRIRELAVQSANGIYTEEDRMYIQIEVSALVAEVDRIASHAQFNGMNMLTGAMPPAGRRQCCSKLAPTWIRTQGSISAK